MEEDLYRRRWEAKADSKSRNCFAPTHKGYRDTLKELYILVLKYQATLPVTSPRTEYADYFLTWRN